MADLLAAFPGRLLSEVIAEVERLPAGLLERVLEAKAYRQAHAMVEGASNKAEAEALPSTPLVKLAIQIMTDLARGEMG